MEHKVTLKDIAKEIGISVSTVSRVINKSLPVSKEITEKVEEAIKKLNYQPDMAAISLKTGKSKTIGLIIPDISNPFFATIAKGAEDIFRKNGYSLIMCNSDKNIDEEIRLINVLANKKIDGLILTEVSNNSSTFDLIKKRNIMTVFLDRTIEDPNISYVISDNKNGMSNLLEYLYGRNYRNYVFIGGDSKTSSESQRLESFKNFIDNQKVSYKIFEGEYTFESGYKIAKNINLNKKPDVIVCGNDLIAYGVIEYLKDKNIKIPDDISVTGYDDIFFSKMFSPPLTTVKQPVYKMGTSAADLLLKMIEGKKLKKHGIILENELIIRNSTR